MEGHTEASGYAASLRQMAGWVRAMPAPPEDVDLDELEAAAAFIERQAAALAALLAAAPSEPETGTGGEQSATRQLAEIDALLSEDQGDDDGSQILPDFEPGMSALAKVATCVHLLERRRDALDAYGGYAPRPAETRGPSDGDGSQGATPTGDRLSSDDQIASRSDPPDFDPSREEADTASPWHEELDLSDHVRKLINEDMSLLSLLYDLDLLPEQLLSQDEKTPGLIKAYHRLYGVLYAYQAFVAPPPAQGIEAEGCDRQGAAHESPVGRPSDVPESTPSNTVATPLDPASTPDDPTSVGEVLEPPFRTGDHVAHGPSEETWVVAYADPETGRLAALGWPDSEVNTADCRLAARATDAVHRETLADLKRSGGRRWTIARRLYGDVDLPPARSARGDRGLV